MKIVKSVALVAACVALIGLGLPRTARGADGALRMTSASVSIDGAVRSGEYTYSRESEGITLHLAWSENSLFAAVVAPTSGWVGVGFKSDRMNNAEILIGYVKEGKAVLSQQRGKGHSHGAAAVPYLRGYAMAEMEKTTVLEAELDAKALIRGGQDSMLFIVAYGGDDTPTSYHRARTGMRVNLER